MQSPGEWGWRCLAKVPTKEKASRQWSPTGRQGQPQERGRAGKAGWTRGRVSLCREGWETSDLARAGQHPQSRHSDLRGHNGVLRSSKPQRSWALGTCLGGLLAKGVHGHITTFPTNRPNPK